MHFLASLELNLCEYLLCIPYGFISPSAFYVSMISLMHDASIHHFGQRVAKWLNILCFSHCRFRGFFWKAARIGMPSFPFCVCSYELRLMIGFLGKRIS